MYSVSRVTLLLNVKHKPDLKNTSISANHAANFKSDETRHTLVFVETAELLSILIGFLTKLSQTLDKNTNWISVFCVLHVTGFTFFLSHTFKWL